MSTTQDRTHLRSPGRLRRDRRRATALRRGRRGAADRPAARLPRVLVRLAAADPAARGGRFPRRRARHARLQPVIEAGRRRGLRRRPAGRRHRRSHPRTRRRVRAAGRSRLGRIRRLGPRDEPPRGRGPAGHPQRGPPAEAVAGTAPPGPAPQVLVLLLLRPPGPARNRRARQPLAFLPALPARRPPGLHAGGNRPLRRGLVAAGRGHRDDQLLPVLGAASPKKAEAALRPVNAPTLVIWGNAIATSVRTSPSPTTTTSPTWTASSACPTPRTGCTTTRPSASPNCSSTSSAPPGQPGTDQDFDRREWGCCDWPARAFLTGADPGEQASADSAAAVARLLRRQPSSGRARSLAGPCA